MHVINHIKTLKVVTRELVNYRKTSLYSEPKSHLNKIMHWENRIAHKDLL